MYDYVHLMANCWFGLVVLNFGIPLWKGLLPSILVEPTQRKQNKQVSTRFKLWLFYPQVGGHDSPLKGSLKRPQKVTKNCQACIQSKKLECVPYRSIATKSSWKPPFQLERVGIGACDHGGACVSSWIDLDLKNHIPDAPCMECMEIYLHLPSI